MPQSLNLWNQNLGRVPGDVFQQTQLTTLILAGNALTELPPEINALSISATTSSPISHRNSATSRPSPTSSTSATTAWFALLDSRGCLVYL